MKFEHLPQRCDRTARIEMLCDEANYDSKDRNRWTLRSGRC
jgi:hypothetical protein